MRSSGTRIDFPRGVLLRRRSDYVPGPLPRRGNDYVLGLLLGRRSALHSSSWNDMRIPKTTGIPHDVAVDVGPDGDPSALAKVCHVDSGRLATHIPGRHASPTNRIDSRILGFLAGMAVMLDLDVAARKQALEVMAMRMATSHGLNSELVFRALWR